ncbi:MAG: hypothetical protein JRN26_05560 [Nitrososphaerota archaeon]|jgi:hypothetical protein|nr:hypothetical protein [Nitrososphaerota archaeon]MDG6927192.1 hypothetical protein [Nitrososphaerota archaeon]MDG6930820.1 hypothetical protein [Nitrososphaerota archaeon]MDG6932264.1 hypothetical protein [Nitrososphaerota archaeon]MDG6936331.1 hypothetical protein [Nitrososphaerota archaeon]
MVIDAKKKEYEIKDYGTVTITNDGLLFRLEVNGQVFSFLISHESTIENYLDAIDKTLNRLGIKKEARAEIIRNFATIMPELVNESVVKQKYYVPFWVDGDTCYEAIRTAGKDMFIYYEKGKYMFSDYIDANTVRVHPVQYIKPYTFDDNNEYINQNKSPDLKSVYEEVHSIVTDYFYYSDPRLHKFLSLYIIHSYMLTRSIGSVFLWLIGARRSGKTTLQIISESLGYRPFSGVTPSEPAIYRTLGWEIEYAPLIIIREFEKANDTMREIAREGDIPGATVPRSDKEYDRMVVRNFHIYGSRIVGSNKLHGDDADSDRYMFIRAIHGKPKKPRSQLYRNKAVMANLNQIRNDLLLWKVANYASFEVPDEDSQIEEGRDWEHFGGIITLAKMISPELEQEMREFVKEYLKEKDEETGNSAITAIINIIFDMSKESNYSYENDKIRVPFEQIWSRLKDEMMPYIDKTGKQSETKLIGNDNRVISTHWVGSIIKEQLFGHVTKWRDGPSTVHGYIWSKDELLALKSIVPDMPKVPDVPINKGKTEQKTGSLDNIDPEHQVNETKKENNGNVKKDDKIPAQTPLTTGTTGTNAGSGTNLQEDNKKYVIARTIDTYLAINSTEQEERQLSGYRVYLKDVEGKEVKLYTCMKCGFATTTIAEALNHMEACKK